MTHISLVDMTLVVKSICPASREEPPEDLIHLLLDPPVKTGDQELMERNGGPDRSNQG